MQLLQCENCRRQLGAEQLECPRRNLGQEKLCPYRVEESRLPSSNWGLMWLVGLGITLVPLTAILIGGVLPFWIPLVLLPLMLIGLFMMGFAVYQLLGRRKTIFNPQSGQAWQQTTVLGLPLDQTIISSIEKIPWKGAAARSLRYPASVAELCRQGKAPDMFAAALLQLLAQQVISLGEVKVYRRIGKPGRMYVLLPGEKYGATEVQGQLETRLAGAVGQAHRADREFEFQGRRYARTCRSVLCLEDVIQMVFEGGKMSPDQFLIREVVGKEAALLGLGEVEGHVIQKFSPGVNVLGKVSLDVRSVDQLKRDFWTSQPEHAQDLLAQLDLLVHAMTTSIRDTNPKSANQA